MAVTLSPNMMLPIPGVGTESAPTWAFDLNSSLTLLDGHDHTPGKGVVITPAAMNINSNLSLNNNFLISIAGLTLSPQGSTPAINTVYESGVDLYYIDGIGNNIQITSNGGIAGSPGSISGLTSPASATYVSATKTFVWQSGVSIAANLDAASILLRNITPNSTNALTLQPPSTLSSNYSITLPPLPGAAGVLLMDTSGVQAVGLPIGTQLSPSANILGTQLDANANILGTQLQSSSLETRNYDDQSITTAKIADGAITNIKLATNAVSTGNIVNGSVTKIKQAGPIAASSSSQTASVSGGSLVQVGSLTAAITTVYGARVYLQPHSNGSSPGFITITGNGSSVPTAFIAILKNGIQIATWEVGGSSTGAGPYYFPISTVYLEDFNSPGANTYTLYAQNNAPNCIDITFANCHLFVEEV